MQQSKDETLKQLQEKGLIKETNKDYLYDKLLEAEKEKNKKNDATVKSIIEEMKKRNINLVL